MQLKYWLKTFNKKNVTKVEIDNSLSLLELFLVNNLVDDVDEGVLTHILLIWVVDNLLIE